MTGLLDQLAAKHRVYISDLRLRPALRWESLEELQQMSQKEQYPLKMWEDTVSYLLGCDIRFQNYLQMENTLHLILRSLQIKSQAPKRT